MHAIYFHRPPSSWALWALVWCRVRNNSCSVLPTCNGKSTCTSPLLQWCSCLQTEVIRAMSLHGKIHRGRPCHMLHDLCLCSHPTFQLLLQGSSLHRDTCTKVCGSLSLSNTSWCCRGESSGKTATGPDWRRQLIALKVRKGKCKEYVWQVSMSLGTLSTERVQDKNGKVEVQTWISQGYRRKTYKANEKLL